MTAAAMQDLMQRCIANCTECHSVCLQTLSYCINMGGSHTEEFHLKSMIDCAESCAVSADFMLRGSVLHPKMCGVCAEACMLCATSCEQMGDDQPMKRCAEVCRRCSGTCREMADMKTSVQPRKAA